jgi:hypothetical protein
MRLADSSGTSYPKTPPLGGLDPKTGQHDGLWLQDDERKAPSQQPAAASTARPGARDNEP